jgi:glycosyltransferase involved in cell wall biosynthesis
MNTQLSISSKRILILGQTPPPFGGQAINIQKMLAVLDQHQFQFKHIRLDFSEELNDMGSFNFKKAFKLIKIFWKIVWEMMVYQPHYIYYPPAGPTRNAVYRDLVLLFPIKLFGFKRIFHFHAGGIATIYPQLNQWAKCLFRYVYFNAEQAICLSKAGTIDAHFLQIKSINIIASGVASFTSAKFSKEQDSFIVLFAGLCSESKGILDFIAVLKQSRKFNNQIKGRVIGKPSSALEANALMEAEKEGILEYLGVVTGKEKEAVFLSSSAFLFPTVFESENFPTVIVEAFAAAVPVISTNWRGIPDLVIHEQNGFLHEPHDIPAMVNSLTALANDAVLYERLSANAKNHFDANYSLGTFEASIVAYFNQLE